MWRSELWCSFHPPFQYLKKAKRSGLSETCHKCLRRLKGRHRGCAYISLRKKDCHSMRARDERGVSIWAELRMRAGELLEKRRSGAEAERDYIHTYIHTYTRTHTHTNTYIQKCKKAKTVLVLTIHELNVSIALTKLTVFSSSLPLSCTRL